MKIQALTTTIVTVLVGQISFAQTEYKANYLEKYSIPTNSAHWFLGLSGQNPTVVTSTSGITSGLMQGFDSNGTFANAVDLQIPFFVTFGRNKALPTTFGAYKYQQSNFALVLSPGEKDKSTQKIALGLSIPLHDETVWYCNYDWGSLRRKLNDSTKLTLEDGFDRSLTEDDEQELIAERDSIIAELRGVKAEVLNNDLQVLAEYLVSAINKFYADLTETQEIFVKDRNALANLLDELITKYSAVEENGKQLRKFVNSIPDSPKKDTEKWKAIYGYYQKAGDNLTQKALNEEVKKGAEAAPTLWNRTKAGLFAAYRFESPDQSWESMTSTGLGVGFAGQVPLPNSSTWGIGGQLTYLYGASQYDTTAKALTPRKNGLAGAMRLTFFDQGGALYAEYRFADLNSAAGGARTVWNIGFEFSAANQWFQIYGGSLAGADSNSRAVFGLNWTTGRNAERQIKF
jgi:hypothetical protein